MPSMRQLITAPAGGGNLVHESRAHATSCRGNECGETQQDQGSCSTRSVGLGILALPTILSARIGSSVFPDNLQCVTNGGRISAFAQLETSDGYTRGTTSRSVHWRRFHSSSDSCPDCFPFGRGGRLRIPFLAPTAVITTGGRGLFGAGDSRCFRRRTRTGIVSGW